MAEQGTTPDQNCSVAALRRIMQVVVAGALVGVPLATWAASDEGPLITGRAEVVDGDTLKIGPVAIRIHGIDAPEQSQQCGKNDGQNWSCGEAATSAMTDLVADRIVECVPLDTDAYRRIVARCHAGGVDLGDSMVGRGLAWAYRADRWRRAIVEAPEGCPIKGNISSKGERIYHTPWSPAYAKTRINEGEGERWFCDEAAAIADGWRAARWR